MRNSKVIVILLLIGFLFMSYKIPKPIDYLGIGHQLKFNNESYELAWSAQPSDNYYKQEYLRKGEALPNYEKLVLIEAVKGNIQAEQVAQGKIEELENLKKDNPIINYKVFKNEAKNEIVLDFIISYRKDIYEWNVYRYQNQKNEFGNYLVLYSYSYRNYSSTNIEKTQFFTTIKSIRNNLIGKITIIPIPKVQIE